MTRYAFLVPLAVIAVTSISSLGAIGNTFGDQDYQLLLHLMQKIEVFRSDIFDSRRALLFEPRSYASQSYACFNSISRELESVDASLSELKSLVKISGQMVNPRDEAFVNQYIKEDVNYQLKQLGFSREGVNLSTGDCSNSAIVTTKVRSILSLFIEVENAFRLIAQRA